jgi:hypothetical protein
MTNSSFRSLTLTSISLLSIFGISLGLSPRVADANISSFPEKVVVKQKLIAELLPDYQFSGVYKCNDGGTYYVRQSGSSVWWYGESGDGVSWTNVFKGTIQSGEVRGNWVDVPKGSGQGSGIMVIRQVDRNKFISTRKTGGFSGSEWTRQ